MHRSLPFLTTKSYIIKRKLVNGDASFNSSIMVRCGLPTLTKTINRTYQIYSSTHRHSPLALSPTTVASISSPLASSYLLSRHPPSWCAPCRRSSGFNEAAIWSLGAADQGLMAANYMLPVGSGGGRFSLPLSLSLNSPFPYKNKTEKEKEKKEKLGMESGHGDNFHGLVKIFMVREN